jgi:hypothetical protein
MTARRRPRAQRRPPPPPPPPPQSLAAETLLLDLARALTAPGVAKAGDLAGAVALTAAAYAPDGALAAALRSDWPRVASDKTAALALAWAREQVRVALVDLLQHARDARLLRAGGAVDTLAWLWLAACEALAHEPRSAVADRVQALVGFLTEG